MKPTESPKNFSQNVLVVSQMGKWGDCRCGGAVLYYSDYGVRCEKCQKLHGTWVENIKKAKEEERQRKEDLARRIEIKKFDDELLI